MLSVPVASRSVQFLRAECCVDPRLMSVFIADVEDAVLTGVRSPTLAEALDCNDRTWLYAVPPEPGIADRAGRVAVERYVSLAAASPFFIASMDVEQLPPIDEDGVVMEVGPGLGCRGVPLRCWPDDQPDHYADSDQNQKRKHRSPRISMRQASTLRRATDNAMPDSNRAGVSGHVFPQV